MQRVKLLTEAEDRMSSYWLFTIKVEDRVNFIRYLAQSGIAASVVHARNDSHTIFANYNSSGLTGLDEFSEKMVCIPVGQWVGEQERKHIVDVIRGQDW